MDRIRAFRLGWLVGFGILSLALWLGDRTVLATLAVVLALLFPILAFFTTFWDAFKRAYREEYERTSEEAGRR